MGERDSPTGTGQMRGAGREIGDGMQAEPHPLLGVTPVLNWVHGTEAAVAVRRRPDPHEKADPVRLPVAAAECPGGAAVHRGFEGGLHDPAALLIRQHRFERGYVVPADLVERDDVGSLRADLVSGLAHRPPV